MDYIAYGWSVEEICRQHLYLTLAEAPAAMGYYFDHQEEIDQEITMEWQQVQENMTNQAAKSPFYTSPLTTPSLLLLASEFPEENGNLPVDLEKHYAILSASRIIAFSSNIAQDLRKLYPKITPEKINIIELFEVNQKIAEEITNFFQYALRESKESSQNQVWLELRKLQESQQMMYLKQQQDYRTMQGMEIYLKELENNKNLQTNNQKLQPTACRVRS